MNKEAKLRYKAGSFDIIRDGDFVLCAVSQKKILLQDLKYWNVELQEPYFSPDQVAQKYKNE
tara:strand:+ start:195 stop:380 length:186 start_codon:yes stop_codon:yes gene_type:complete